MTASLSIPFRSNNAVPKLFTILNVPTRLGAFTRIMNIS